MSLSRRRFLETAALGTIAAGTLAADSTSGLKASLPTRVLGRTGKHVSVLAMGGGSRFLTYGTDELAMAAVNHAIDSGITYLDTAYAYANGLSESRIGKVMATRRKEVFLADKFADRDGDQAMRRVEASLKRLQTDHLDLLNIHSLTDEGDLASIEAPSGVLKRFYQLRDQKVVGALGITSHTDPTVLAKAIERNDFDCVQMALNAARVGMKGATGGMVINPDMKTSFESVALPIAVRKKMGVIAMKIYAADGLVGQATPEKLIQYSLSLPSVALCVIGMPKLEQIADNCRIVKGFKPMPKNEMEEMGTRLSDKNKMALDYFLHHHRDEYAAL
jgi:aryl-alcohol dehydrogenase-like predicted oxidoreductase